MRINSKNEELREFMKTRKSLMWYVKNPEEAGLESIVEHVLNYGTWGDVQELIRIAGIAHVAEAFRKQTTGRRTNYHKKTAHYFRLYFQKYAR